MLQNNIQGYMEAKKRFISNIFDRYRDIIPEYEYFLEIILKRPLKAIRFNTLHYDIELIHDYLEKECELDRLEWCSYAYYIKEEDGIGKSFYHESGLFYIQNITSLLPPLLLTPMKNDWVLDVAASPGGKATHIAQIMGNNGVVVANDVDRKRILRLTSNIRRLGITNTIVTCMDAGNYPKIPGITKILVDAPCSNESLVYRMDTKTLKILVNKKVYQQYSRLQREIISRMAQIMDRGRRLLYCVCTFAPEEAEAVTDYALNHGFRPIKISVPLKYTKGIEEWTINGERVKFSSDVRFSLRVYPHLNFEEYRGNIGFLYISLLEKC
jgi:NOL1/NOP2/sun family putative RNA methylase